MAKISSKYLFKNIFINENNLISFKKNNIKFATHSEKIKIK